MTVAVTSPLTVYPLTGASLGPFATVWNYEQAADVVVYLDTDGARVKLIQGTDYTLSGATPLISGGNVTLASSVRPSGGWGGGLTSPFYRLDVVRAVAAQQTVPFGGVARFQSEAAEEAYDHLTRIAQDQARDLKQAVLTPYGENGLTLPTAATRSGKIAGFDDDGNWDTSRSFVAFDAAVATATAAAVSAEAWAGLARLQISDLSGFPVQYIGPPTQEIYPYSSHGAKWYLYNDDESTAHEGAIATFAIVAQTIGDDELGPASAGSALFVHVQKKDYLTNTNAGEIDAVKLSAYQGRKGDAAVLLIDLKKTRTGSGADEGAGTPIELGSQLVDASGTVFKDLHWIPGFTETVGGVSVGLGFGNFVEARFGQWYSAYHASAYGADDPDTDFLWAYSAALSRDPADVFFRIQWGSGAWFIGAPDDCRELNYNNMTGTFFMRKWEGDTGTILTQTDLDGVFVSNGLVVGGKKLVFMTAAFCQASRPALASLETKDVATITVPGVVEGDIVTTLITTTDSTLTVMLHASAQVVDFDTVVVRLGNITASALMADATLLTFAMQFDRWTS